MLEKIREKLKHLPPQPTQPLGDDKLREAAVLMAVIQSENPSVIFIKRAEHVSSHRGQVAFPGGMWEIEDSSLMATALRESHEEIDLLPAKVEMIAGLKPIVTRLDVRVSPFVGFVPEGLNYIPEKAELDAVFQVPISHLLEASNYTRTRFPSPMGTYDAPCIFYEEYCIWGFTFGIMLDVLKKVFDFELEDRQEPFLIVEECNA